MEYHPTDLLAYSKVIETVWYWLRDLRKIDQKDGPKGRIYGNLRHAEDEENIVRPSGWEK